MKHNSLLKCLLTLLLAGCAGLAGAASVGTAGHTNTFTTQPTAADWSTLGPSGTAGGITTAADLTAAVQTNLAGGITAQLASVLGTNGPGGTPPGTAAVGVWGTNGFLQSRANTAAYTMIMGTFVNNTGTNATSIRVSYDLGVAVPRDEVAYGFLVYYSLTGAANSWSNLATLQATNSATLSTNVALPAAWNDGATLYLLFADDNGPINPDTANQIDNFFLGVIGGPPNLPTVSITAPTNTQTFVQGTSITIDAGTTGSVTNVAFYQDGVFIGNDPAAAYSAVYSNATVGGHALTAVATSGTGLFVTSSVVNISVTAPPASAIQVGLSGAGPFGFGTLPAVTNGWSTTNIAGAAADVATAATVDAAVQSAAATMVSLPLTADATSPTPAKLALAQWNSTGLFIQSHPTGTRVNLLMATLQNNSGTNIASFTVAYNFGEVAGVAVEEVPGLRVFYSLTGASNTWLAIPALTTGTTGALTAPISLGSWPAGNTMYLLWADDNASGAEGAYTIDNFVISNVVPLVTTIAIASPTNTQIFGVGANITVDATAFGLVTNVLFYLDGGLVSSDSSVPYSFVYSNAASGAHTFQAVATDTAGLSVTSSLVNITVALVPPTVTITAPTNTQSLVLGADITINATVTGGLLTNVVFYRDGAVVVGIDPVSPFSAVYSGATLGAHTLTAVVQDSLGQKATSAVVNITVVTGPGIQVGLSGAGTFGFATLPTLQDGWTTASIAGDNNTLQTIAEMNNSISNLLAASVNTALLSDPTVPTAVTPLFRHNSGGGYLNSRPTTFAAAVLLATLQNVSGSGLASMTVSYNFGENAGVAGEQLAGLFAYWSLTGTAGSWVPIANFTQVTPGALSATLSLTNWPAGSAMYLVWTDDNANGGTEGAYTIDNFLITNVVTSIPVPVSIITQPPNLAVSPGQAAVFTVGVSGTTPYTYAWYFGTNAIFGGNGSTYTIPSATTNDAGQYHVVVSNSFSGATSSNATLTVAPQPIVIVTQPVGVGVAPGSPASFTVVVSGATPYSYQWRLNGSPILDATNQTYNIASAAPANAGSYSVVVNNSFSSATSANAILAVTAPPYTLLSLSNVWKFNQTNVDFGTEWREVGYNDSTWPSGPGLLALETAALPEPIRTALALISPPSATQTPTYYFRTQVVLTNPPSTVTLTVTNLVDDGAVFYVNGVEIYRLNMPTGPVSFNTLATAAATEGVFQFTTFLSDLWIKGTNVLAVEVHQSSLTSSDVVFGMKIVATEQPPTSLSITSQPVSLIVEETKSASFRVGVAGTGALYQWFKDGTPISGADAATYTIPVTATNHSGIYFAMVSNAVITLFSDLVTLTVFPDTNGPTLVFADGTIATTNVLVSFSELVSAATATNAANYTIKSTTGTVVPVLSATLKNGTNVLLHTGARPTGTNHILTVNGVRDVALASNLILTNSAIPISTILSLVSLNSFWDYIQPLEGIDTFPDATWRTMGYNAVANGWGINGQSLFAFDLANEPLPVARNTSLSSGGIVTYFRQKFLYNASPFGATVRFRHVVDDGAVFYLNNVEIFRYNMPGGTINSNTAALAGIGVAGLSSFIDIPLTNLVLGTNILAVEMHGLSAVDNDYVFAMELQAFVQSITNGPLVIAGQPANRTVLEGQSAAFSFSASAALTAQWQRNGTNIAGATNTTYTIAVTTLAMNNDLYRVIASSPTSGSVTSSAALLHVISLVPPTLQITRTGGGVVSVSWTGSGYTLQQTTNLLSSGTPWADVPGPVTTSPFTTNNPTGNLFFRVRP